LREHQFAVVEIGSSDVLQSLTFAIRNSTRRMVSGQLLAIFIEDLEAVAEVKGGLTLLDTLVRVPVVTTAPFLSTRTLGRFAHVVYFSPFRRHDASQLVQRAMRILSLPPLSEEGSVLENGAGDGRQLILQAAFVAGMQGRDNVPSPYNLFRLLAQKQGDPELSTPFQLLLLQENAPHALTLSDCAEFASWFAEIDAVVTNTPPASLDENADAVLMAAWFRSRASCWVSGTAVNDPRAARRPTTERPHLPWCKR
jgi:hypothetical protein